MYRDKTHRRIAENSIETVDRVQLELLSDTGAEWSLTNKLYKLESTPLDDEKEGEKYERWATYAGRKRGWIGIKYPVKKGQSFLDKTAMRPRKDVRPGGILVLALLFAGIFGSLNMFQGALLWKPAFREWFMAALPDWFWPALMMTLLFGVPGYIIAMILFMYFTFRHAVFAYMVDGIYTEEVFLGETSMESVDLPMFELDHYYTKGLPVTETDVYNKDPEQEREFQKSRVKKENRKLKSKVDDLRYKLAKAERDKRTRDKRVDRLKKTADVQYEAVADDVRQHMKTRESVTGGMGVDIKKLVIGFAVIALMTFAGYSLVKGLKNMAPFIRTMLVLGIIGLAVLIIIMMILVVWKSKVYGALYGGARGG